MMRDIAIIGIGGIGQRHAQSCATLPANEYRLHLVEPSDENRERTDRLLSGREAVIWYGSTAELPRSIDLAIVATRADVRAAVVREVLERTSARALILEKVLFQNLDDYAATAKLLLQAGATAWVNCPRRMWPAYKGLREKLEGRTVVRIDVSGTEWDIGCNAVHFIDLLAFLTDANQLVVDEVKLGDVRPAKRGGMLHIEGVVIGRLMHGTNAAQFTIASTPQHRGPQTIRVELSDGACEIVEGAASITTTAPGQNLSTHDIPFQSQLSALAVKDILSTGRCALALYGESRALHETFIKALLIALERVGKVALGSEACPIT